MILIAIDAHGIPPFGLVRFCRLYYRRFGARLNDLSEGIVC